MRRLGVIRSVPEVGGGRWDVAGSLAAVTDLTPLVMPTADAGTEVWSRWLDSRTTDQLTAARDIVAALKRDRPRRAAELLERWNDINIALGNAMAAAGLIQQVHTDAEIREQAERAEV
jgi:thimet oligopeptidase